jgi:anti-sigma regulatory factor (Ser/Thr protein kinase)
VTAPTTGCCDPHTAPEPTHSEALNAGAQHSPATPVPWHLAAPSSRAAESRQVLLVLPREKRSAPIARALAAAVCRDIDNLDADDVELVTDELVANTALHAAAPNNAPDTVTVAIALTKHEMRLEVGDSDPRLPTERHTTPDAESGRGMSLVHALCHRHGVQARDDGKITWASWTRR